MPTKKSIKYRTDNIFERMTGLKIHEMVGGSECHVVAHPRILYRKKQYMTRAVAASLYYSLDISEIGRVTSTCQVSNCVNPEHLVLQNKNIEENPVSEFKKKVKAVRSKKQQDTPDEKGFYYGYHPDVWNSLSELGKELARKGEYDVTVHGWEPKYRIA